MSGTNERDAIRDEGAILAPDNAAIENGRKSYRFSITNSATSFGPIDIGTYKVWIEGGTNSNWMEYVTAVSAVGVAITSPTSSGVNTGEIRGDDIVRIRIKSGLTFLWAKTGTGTFTLHMIPVL
jgi:hypothetical protein